jgi:cytidylate kinase
MAVITIAHQIGSGGQEIGKAVAKRLQLPYIDREIVKGIASKLGISENLASEMDEKIRGTFQLLFNNLAYYSVMALPYCKGDEERLVVDEAQYQDAAKAVIEASAASHRAVIAGHGANFCLAEQSGVLSVFIYAPVDQRIKTLMRREGIEREAAARMVRQCDHDRANYIKTYYGANWRDSSYYHLMINTGTIRPELAADLIVQAAQTGALEPLKPKPPKGHAVPASSGLFVLKPSPAIALAP